MEFPQYERVVCLGFLVTQTGVLTPTLQARVDRAIDHYRVGRTQTLVMSGGRLDFEPCTAASAMKTYAIKSGIPETDIIEQGDALDTVGEAICLRLLLPPVPVGSRILIVTSDFHALRAERIFKFVFGKDFELSVDAVPNGPHHETSSDAKEAASLERFRRLFRDTEAGDIEAVLTRFWGGHALYNDAGYGELRRRTFAALAAAKKS